MTLAVTGIDVFELRHVKWGDDVVAVGHLVAAVAVADDADVGDSDGGTVFGTVKLNVV